MFAWVAMDLVRAPQSHSCDAVWKSKWEEGSLPERGVKSAPPRSWESGTPEPRLQVPNARNKRQEFETAQQRNFLRTQHFIVLRNSLWSQEVWVQILTPALTGCVALGKQLNPSASTSLKRSQQQDHRTELPGGAKRVSMCNTFRQEPVT